MSTRSRRLAMILAVALSGLASPLVVFAAGGEGKPAASAAADKPVEKDKPAADAGAGDAGPRDGGPGPVDGGEALPPGHPPVGEGLPPGHPTTGNDPHAHGDEEDAHGQRGRFFEPPPDLAIDDPSLPPGTLLITIKDADDRPMANAPVVIGILESSVAKGDSRKRKSLDMDAQGSARLDGLSIGGGTSYRVTTTRDGATYASDAFALTDKGGKRVVVHAYEATANVEDVLLGMQAFVFISLKEDVLSVEHMFNIFNIGKTAWIPTPDGGKMTLPDKYKAFNTSDAMTDVKFVEGQKNEANLTGTLGPGKNEASFRYHVPLEGTERQTFRLTLPPRVGEVRVFSEAGKSMGLEVAGFPDAQRQRGRDGRKLLITARQAEQGEKGIRTLDITISGLPTPGPGRWIAVLCALGALGFAAAYVVKQRDEVDTADDVRDDLLEARDALLGEFVVLEKAHRKGDIGPKNYARFRTALLDALARIETRLDEVRAKRSAKRRQDRGSRTEAHGEGGAS